MGNAYGHIALGVNDIYGTCEQINARGGKVVREPGPMKHGSTVIAFVEDPNGYKVELIQLGTQDSKSETAGISTCNRYPSNPLRDNKSITSKKASRDEC